MAITRSRQQGEMEAICWRGRRWNWSVGSLPTGAEKGIQQTFAHWRLMKGDHQQSIFVYSWYDLLECRPGVSLSLYRMNSEKSTGCKDISRFHCFVISFHCVLYIKLSYEVIERYLAWKVPMSWTSFSSFSSITPFPVKDIIFFCHMVLKIPKGLRH